MRLITAFKIVSDDQDIVVSSDRTLDCSHAKAAVSTYDLNAIELAALVPDAEVIGVTVGDTSINDSKAKKNVLARGMSELYMVADDALKDADAFVTASAIAKVTAKIGSYDALVVGDGSADNYAQQVGSQIAGILDIPSINGVLSIAADGDDLIVERALENTTETVKVPTPCVLSVDPEAALPRICTMKEILAAGKKPTTMISVDEIGGVETPALETTEILAPVPIDRKLVVLYAASEGAIDEFAAALKSAVQQ